MTQLALGREVDRRARLELLVVALGRTAPAREGCARRKGRLDLVGEGKCLIAVDRAAHEQSAVAKQCRTQEPGGELRRRYLRQARAVDGHEAVVGRLGKARVGIRSAGESGTGLVAQREDLALESRVAMAAVALAELFDLGEDLVGVALGNSRRGFALAPEDHGANRSRGNLALGLTQGGARRPRPGVESRARFGANASDDRPTRS